MAKQNSRAKQTKKAISVEHNFQITEPDLRAGQNNEPEWSEHSRFLSNNSEYWEKPFHLKYRVGSLLGICVSIVWIWVSYLFVQNQIGFINLVELLPHELTGIVVGVFTPLSLLWVGVAFFERGHKLTYETEVLR